MRICAVSDTHRHRHELLTAVKSTQPFFAILHAGDETSDAQWLSSRVDWPVYGVAGNWDTPTQVFPAEQLFNFGIRILLVHGHRYSVKVSLSLLTQRAQEVGADVVVYGHSHVASTIITDGILHVNPGSLATPRGRRERTFAVIDIDESATRFLVRVSHCLLTGQTVAGLVHTVEFIKSGK